VYPSLEIREGYGNYTVRLTSGQILTGMLDAQNASGVILRDLSGQKTALRQTDIASLEANPVSVMPEGLLGGLSPAELRDLFAYLMRKEER
jgi:putative heme-binding domain-containing protein